MRKRILTIAVATAAAASALTGFTQPAVAAVTCDYYVAPAGNDTAAGSVSAPWKTLTGARDNVRARSLNQNLSDDLAICLRGGRYTLTSTFNLSEADSGSNGYKVIYAAYPGETPIIDGGKQVTGWTQVAGRPYWTANVPTSAGFASYFRQLYVDGVRARLATGPAISGTAFYDDPATPQTKDGITFPAASLKNYLNPTDVRLVHVGCGFKADYFPVVSMTTAGSSTSVTFPQPSFQARVDRGAGCLNYNQSYFVQNALEELDAAGEWYLDQAADKVYYYPVAGQNITTATATVPVVETLVSVAGANGANKAHDITFDGLTFEHGNWAMPANQFIGGSQAEALYGVGQSTYTDEVPGSLWLTNTDNIGFFNNVVRKMGNGGLHLRTGASNTKVTGNRFYNLTAAGVIVGRWADFIVASNQRTKNNTITNNVVHDVGDDFMQGTGISLINSYATTVSYNLVYGTAYSGIHQRSSVESGVVEGVDGIGNTTISYNKVINGGDKRMWGMHDNGAIYSFGAIPGTKIHHNYVSKVTTTRAYMSDNQSFQTRWDDNVADGGPFSAYMPGRNPLSVYAARNYTTTSANTSYQYFIFDVDGAPHVVTGAWPAAAQAIIDGAGLQPAYANLDRAVPSNNLADYGSIAATSGFPASPEKLWDGLSETGEVAATSAEGWIQYDLGRDYQALTFRFQNDNGGTYKATAWKVQRYSDSLAAWVDIMPYQAVGTAAQVSYKPAADLATKKIRLYVKNDNAGGIAAAQEFTVTGSVK